MNGDIEIEIEVLAVVSGRVVVFDEKPVGVLEVGERVLQRVVLKMELQLHHVAIRQQNGQRVHLLQKGYLGARGHFLVVQ